MRATRVGEVARPASEVGMAIVVCLLAMLLLMALGGALVMSTSVETMIAGNFRSAREATYAASASLERAMADLPAVPDWTLLLNGTVMSAFIDGAPGGARTLPDGSTLDLTHVVNLANCRRTTACTDAQMDAVTSERPWGTDNPRWRLLAYGPLRDMLPPGAISSQLYVVVLVADNQAENDGNPSIDGSDESNPGSGRIELRGEAFGPRSAHRGVEATVARTPSGVRVVSWRDLARLDRP